MLEHQKQYYQAALNHFAHILSEFHKIDLKNISKSDALVFLTHIENAKPSGYAQLENCSTMVFSHCKKELSRMVQEGMSTLNEHPKSTFSLIFTPISI